MYNNISGNYPMGAQYDPRAPWNQSEPDETTRDADYTCTLHRTAPVTTTDYVPGHCEIDEDGNYCREGDDFSDTNWMYEFTDLYRTPAKLIEILWEIAEDFAAGRLPMKSLSTWKSIAADCRGWEVDDEDADEV